MKIANVSARKILASTGNETVEAVVVLDNGRGVSAAVPAGISAGKYEIAKVPVDEAISQIGQIGQICGGKDWSQQSLDQEVSGYGFGGNATLAVSAAFFKAQLRQGSAGQAGVKFPKLMVLMFEGGKHGNAMNKISMQEFLVIEETVTQARADFGKIKGRLEKDGVEVLVGAEGGFSPNGFDDIKALDVIAEELPGKLIGLDAAECFAMGACPDYAALASKYNLASIEDPYDDESWERWVAIKKTLGEKVAIVGDDLTATNSERIKKAVDLQAISAVVIKPNQIGTISRAMEAVGVARAGGLKIVVSHRGEETDDDWIADFALAVEADYVKFGGMDRGERVAKYNRLMELGMQ